VAVMGADTEMTAFAALADKVGRYVRSTSTRMAAFVGVITYLSYAYAHGSWTNPALIGVSLFTALPTGLVGVIIAHIKRDDARGTIWESHFHNMIETFWISLVVFIVAIPLCFVVVGIPIMFGVFVWFLYRTIKGLIRAIENQPYY